MGQNESEPTRYEFNNTTTDTHFESYDAKEVVQIYNVDQKNQREYQESKK